MCLNPGCPPLTSRRPTSRITRGRVAWQGPGPSETLFCWKGLSCDENGRAKAGGASERSLQDERNSMPQAPSPSSTSLPAFGWPTGTRQPCTSSSCRPTSARSLRSPARRSICLAAPACQRLDRSCCFFELLLLFLLFLFFIFKDIFY